MWTVTAEGTADQVYEALKQDFDENHVPKTVKKWKARHRTGFAEHQKPVHEDLKGKARKDQDLKALMFRLGLKSVQHQLTVLPFRKAKVTITGDASTFAVKVEEV